MATSIPSEQRAIAVLESKGEYTLITSSVPKPHSGDVLVKLEGAALNHLEWKLPHAPYEIVPYPLHSGTDGAGTVVSVGEGVTKLKEGDKILFQGWFDAERSSFQEYAVVNQHLCAKIPKTMGCLQASSIPLALVTSAFGLCLPNKASPSPTSAAKNFKSPPRGGAGLKRFWEHGSKGSYLNEPIVILGGSSSVGQFAIQIAKYLGFSPIITTASSKHIEHLKSLGAHVVIDRQSSFVDAYSALELEVKTNVVFDTIGAGITRNHIDILAPGGTFVTVGPSIPPSLEFNDGRQGIITFGSAHYYSEFAEAMFAKVEKLLKKGTLKSLKIEKLPGGLSSIPKGLKRLSEGQVTGLKLVVDPSESSEPKDEPSGCSKPWFRLCPNNS